MIKIFNISIRLIFNHCIENNIYPCRWKKANVVPILTKNDKQTLKKATVQCIYFQLAVKFLKDSHITKCLVSLLVQG